MEPIFIYYNNLSFDQYTRFTMKLGNDDLLEGALFKKNKGCYITSMSCFVDPTVDVKKLRQSDNIKEIPGLANAILADGVDFGYKNDI